jgi:hypothetical protein
MTMRRFAFPVLLAVMSISFVIPSYANHLVSATGTISCSDYSLSISADNLSVGTRYTIDYAFTVDSSSGIDDVYRQRKRANSIRSPHAFRPINGNHYRNSSVGDADQQQFNGANCVYVQSVAARLYPSDGTLHRRRKDY